VILARILLAEDDETLRLFLDRALSRAGHTVDSVGDGLSAVAALKRWRYDLLLTDIVMPGMDGVQVAQQAAAGDPSLRIMFITGFAALALESRSRFADQPNIVVKPFHLKDVVGQVDRLLKAQTGTA
jgi:two-component system cell cycle response regulator CpdR